MLVYHSFFDKPPGLIDYRVVIEHVGFYALSRLDHEMADVVHGMIVTVSLDPLINKLPN
jgi:hypothetical protein